MGRLMSLNHIWRPAGKRKIQQYGTMTIMGFLSSNLKLKGYPFGMVIDKAGKIRQTENGFGPEVADLFLDKEIPLIKALLNEN